MELNVGDMVVKKEQGIMRNEVVTLYEIKKIKIEQSGKETFIMLLLQGGFRTKLAKSQDYRLATQKEIDEEKIRKLFVKKR